MNDVAEVNIGEGILGPEESIGVLVVVRDLKVADGHRSCTVARGINLFNVLISGVDHININVLVRRFSFTLVDS